MWIQKHGDDAHMVTLVLGKEKVEVVAETAMLASMSLFLDNTFYGGFAEAQKDRVELPECDAEDFKEILAAMEEAKNNNISKEEKVLELLSPKNYNTYSFLQISENLELLAMHKMTLEQLEQYAEIAQKTDNKSLELAIFLKTLTLFPAFRKTLKFKKMNFRTLKAYMTHPLLEYTHEKEVLEAVLWWLNFNFKRREALIEKALALVNFRKIKHNQIKAVCLFKMMRKSEHLAEIFNNFFEMTLIKMKGWLMNNLPKSDAKVAAEKLMKSAPKKSSLLLSVPFAFKTDDDVKNFKYAIAVLTVSTGEIQDVFFLPEGCSDTDVEFYNFNLYTFGSMCKKVKGDKIIFNFSVKKCNVFTREWKTVTEFGRYKFNERNLQQLIVSKENKIQDLWETNHALELEEYNNPGKVMRARRSEHKNHLFAYLLARQAKVKELMPEQPFVRFKGLEPVLQRYGPKVYINNLIGMDEINLETESSRGIDHVLNLDGTTFFFKKTGNTICGAKFTRRGMVVLNKSSLDTKKMSKFSLFCNYSESRDSKINLLGKDRKFFSAFAQGYVITEVGKNFSVYAERKHSEHPQRYREDRVTKHIVVKFPREVRCQFLHDDKAYFLLGEDPTKGAAHAEQPKEYAVVKAKLSKEPESYQIITDLSGKISKMVASKLNKQVNNCRIKDWAVKPINPLWLQNTLPSNKL